jgi:hypothetical protein
MLLRLLHLPCTLAIVLCIVGGIHQSSSDHKVQESGKTYAKVGVVIFLIAFVQISILALITLPHARNVPTAQRRILRAALLALPLLAIRLLYSILVDFSTSSVFSTTRGNPFVQLGMSIIEEVIIIVLYLAAGVAALMATHQDGGARSGFAGGDYPDQRQHHGTVKGGVATTPDMTA